MGILLFGRRRTRWFFTLTDWQRCGRQMAKFLIRIEGRGINCFVCWFIWVIRLWFILAHSQLVWQFGSFPWNRWVVKGMVHQDSYGIVIVMAQWVPVLCSLIRFMNTPGCLSLLETVLFSRHQWHMSRTRSDGWLLGKGLSTRTSGWGESSKKYSGFSFEWN